MVYSYRVSMKNYLNVHTKHLAVFLAHNWLLKVFIAVLIFLLSSLEMDVGLLSLKAGLLLELYFCVG